jgi:hypothetical protein
LSPRYIYIFEICKKFSNFLHPFRLSEGLFFKTPNKEETVQIKKNAFSKKRLKSFQNTKIPEPLSTFKKSRILLENQTPQRTD